MSKTIVHADDSASVRRWVAEQLADRNFRVVSVPDGEAALPLLQRQCVRRGQLTGAVQSWYQDLLEDRLNALRSFTGRRASSDG